MPPHDLDAERAVLGAVLVCGERWADCAGLSAQSFYRQAHGLTFSAMSRLAGRGMAIDLVTLRDELRKADQLDNAGGAAYLSGLTDGVPRSINAQHYAAIVREKARDRQDLWRLDDARERIFAGQRDQAMAGLRGLDDAPDDELLLEPVSAIAARGEAQGPGFLIADLVYDGCVSLFFGLERTFKSLAIRHLAVDLAMARPAFGLARLRVTDEPVAVAIITEEDAAGSVLGHLDSFSDGAASRGDLPIHMSACKGISIDDPRVQARLLRDFAICQPKLVVFEPLRSLTSCVDQGPRDLQPLTLFVRRVIRETGAAVILGHHAVKPTAGRDGRTGNARVSGGGLISISEAPIEFTRVDDFNVRITPRGFKHSATPAPLNLRLDTIAGRVSRLVANEYAPPPDAGEQATSNVLAVVKAEPGLSGSAIAVRAGGRKTDALAALRALELAGRLKAQRNGRGSEWHAV